MSHSHRPLLAILVAIAAVACFGALDTTTKVVSTTVTVVMAMWVRYLFQSATTLVSVLPRDGMAGLRTPHMRLHVQRALTMVLCNCAAYLSFRHMPVAEVTAIIMLTPLVMTVVGALAFGEQVSLARWALVIGGFVGAVIIVRPGSDLFEWAAIYPLLLLAGNTAYQTLTSRLARLEEPRLMHFWGGSLGLAAFTVVLPFAWQVLPATTWALLLLIGLFATLGHYLLILAYRHAPISLVTPYLYCQIGFAMLGGWLVFAHAPDGWAFFGIAVIAACGAAGTWLAGHEQRRRGRSTPAEAAASGFPAG